MSWPLVEKLFLRLPLQIWYECIFGFLCFCADGDSSSRDRSGADSSMKGPGAQGPKGSYEGPRGSYLCIWGGGHIPPPHFFGQKSPLKFPKIGDNIKPRLEKKKYKRGGGGYFLQPPLHSRRMLLFDFHYFYLSHIKNVELIKHYNSGNRRGEICQELWQYIKLMTANVAII